MRKIIGQIVDGEFVPGKPESNSREHYLNKEYKRLHMREKYARDVVQPYQGGEVNQEYIEAYGREEAFKQFGIRSVIE
jgi:hypothetical protein